MSESVDGIVEARAQYERVGLPFPYVPPELVDQVKQVSEWVFGTRSDGPSPYRVGWYMTEVVTAPVDAYVLFGQAGHGINSYAAHYFLKHGPLALFTQYEWGGAYTPDDAANQIVDRYGAIVALVTLVKDAVAAGKFAHDEQLIVVDSDIGGTSWRTLRGFDEGHDALLEERWQTDDNPIVAAANEVRKRLGR